MNHKLKRYIHSFLCAFIFALCQSLMFSLYPIMAKDLAISLSELIAVFGVGSSIFFVSAPLWTSCSEKLGRTRTLMFCMFGLCVSILLLYFCVKQANSQYLWASRIVYGIFAGGIVPITQALFSEGASDKLLSNFALHAQSTTIGRIVGPLVGLAAARTDLAATLFVLFIICLLLSLTSLGLKDKIKSNKRALEAIFLIPNLNHLYILCILVVAFAIIVMSIQSTLAALFEKQILDYEKFTLTNSLIFVGGNFVMMINQKFIKNYKENTLLMYGSLFFVLSSSLFVFSSWWQLSAIAYVFFCLGLSNVKVGLLSYFCHKNPESRSSVIAVISLVQTAGYAIASMIVASLLHISMSLVYFGALSASLLLLGFSSIEGNKRAKRKAL